MYSTFIEEGLIANPQLLKSGTHWKNPSLFAELKKRRVSIREIDKIFRKHHVKCYLILEWIAARDTIKDLRKAGRININPNLVGIVSKDYRHPIEKVNEDSQGLERRERDLNDQVVKLFGSLGIRKLTGKDVKQWPVFTSIMIDLYNYLIPFFKTKPHYYSELRDQSKYSVYPKKLFEVIAGLLQEYYPSYFKDFTPNNAKTRIKPPSKR
jgi:hypothetical protein